MISTSYINKVITVMRNRGISNNSLTVRMKVNQEDRKAWEINQIRPYPFTLIMKPLRKLFQFFIT